MIKYILFTATVTFLLACNRHQHENPTIVKGYFVALDTADWMVESYIASIGDQETADNLRSWAIDAEGLREYLADTSIKEVNIALAHTVQYIEDGNFGVPSGLSPTALTIVLTGVNADGGIVNYENAYALNRAKPCPPICFPANTSARK